MPSDEILLAKNITYTDALSILKNKNLTDAQINSVIWGVLGETTGKSQRRFSYKVTFESTAPECVAAFVRSFAHVDWIDGESIVQAEENSIEEGFNRRFHKIEADLDALDADVRKVFDCTGKMRAEIADRLEEIKLELNRINADVHEKCQPVATVPTRPIDPGYNYPPMPGPGYPLPGSPFPIPLPTPIPQPGPGIGGGGNPRPWYEGGSIVDILKGIDRNVYSGGSLIRMTGDPTRGTVAGMPARRLDVRDMNGETYEVWSTPAGLMMTPLVETSPESASDRTWSNPRVEAVGALSGWVATKSREVTVAFGGRPFTVDALRDRFGDQKLEGGFTLADALETLPPSLEIARPEAVVDAFAERAGRDMVRDGLVAETLVANVGINSDVAGVDETPITEVKGIPKESRKALNAAGVRTLGEFNAIGPQRTVALLNNANITVDLGEAGRWAGEAKAISALGRSLR